MTVGLLKAILPLCKLKKLSAWQKQDKEQRVDKNKCCFYVCAVRWLECILQSAVLSKACFHRHCISNPTYLMTCRRRRRRHHHHHQYLFSVSFLLHFNCVAELTVWFTCMLNLSLLCVWYVDLTNSKGKAIPLQAWTGPEGSRRLRFPDFKTVGTWRW